MSEYSYDKLKEFMKLISSNDVKETVAKVKGLAESVDPYGLELYGDFLISGLWNLDKMEMDMATETLLSSTEDPKEDPYFLVARDRNMAIQYYKTANEFAKRAGSEYWLMQKRVQYKLMYCAEKGMVKDVSADKFEMRVYKDLDYFEAKSINRFLDHSAKLSKTDIESNNKSDVRPKVNNPRTVQFKNVAGMAWVKSLIGCVVIQVLTLVGLFAGYWKFFKLFSLILVGFNLPMLILAYLTDYYGEEQNMPTCGCSKLRKAYEMQLEKLPIECKALPDPFEKTPFFVRNLNNIRISVLNFTTNSFHNFLLLFHVVLVNVWSDRDFNVLI